MNRYTHMNFVLKDTFFNIRLKICVCVCVHGCVWVHIHKYFLPSSLPFLLYLERTESRTFRSWRERQRRGHRSFSDPCLTHTRVQTTYLLVSRISVETT